MSDPIKKILMQLDKEMAAAVAVGSGKGLGNHDNEIKQIRQQIGREINKVAVRRGHFLAVREVCQLEEE